ncbi:MAG: MGH1-like glycoside hydrolase domain-containing protein [Candidatus Ratteibacteria bacterium]
MDLIVEWKTLIDESTYPAEYPFPGEWVSFGKGYPVKGLGGWETSLIAHEVKDFDLDRAKHLMVLYLKSCYREEDGMLASKVVAKSDNLYSMTKKGRIYKYSHAPIWSFTARKILEKQWDEKFALLCFDIGINNLKWWEENRKDRIGLFWYFDSYPDEKESAESGHEHSPRWDFTDLGPFPCIDLNCQILIYLENLIFLAEKLGRVRERDKIFSMYENLKATSWKYFWDELIGIFCDYDLTGMNAKKTTASFWALISGLASQEDTERMVTLLLDPKEFFAPHGLPVVSLSEPAFELDFWRGALWPSEVFWVCAGLQKYKFDEIAKKIARICLENIFSTFKNTGKFWEFYNPLDGNISKLKRNKSSKGPFPDCPASVPVISLEKIAEGEKVC